jgi:hypothetical protein
MNRWLSFVFASFLVGACSHDATTPGPPELPSDDAEAQGVCINAWHNVVQEWKESGGKFRRSIRATRREIERNDNSRLARWISESWRMNSSPNTSERFGTWPVATDEYRSVMGAFEREIGDDFPFDCRISIWLTPLLWEELIAASPEGDESPLKFDEVPESVDWTSPVAAQWTTYWLLKAVQSEEE